MKIEIDIDDDTQEVSAGIAGVDTPSTEQRWVLTELTAVTKYYTEQLGFPEKPPTGETNGTPS